MGTEQMTSISGAPQPSTVERISVKQQPPPKGSFHFIVLSPILFFFFVFTSVEKTGAEIKQEREKIRQYIEEKRKNEETKITNEKRLKKMQDDERKNKLKQLNEQIKKVSQQPFPPSLIKKPPTPATVRFEEFDFSRKAVIFILFRLHQKI